MPVIPAITPQIYSPRQMSIAAKLAGSMATLFAARLDYCWVLTALFNPSPLPLNSGWMGHKLVWDVGGTVRKHHPHTIARPHYLYRQNDASRCATEKCRRGRVRRRYLLLHLHFVVQLLDGFDWYRISEPFCADSYWTGLAHILMLFGMFHLLRA